MRRVVLVAPGRLLVEEVPEPTPAAGEVTVRVEATGICGSDLFGYWGVNERRPPGTVMGHEISGRVEWVGPGVNPAWIGKGVAINPILGCELCKACQGGNPQRCSQKVLIGCVPEHPGGLAEVLAAPARSLELWPGPAPLTWGAFAEPLAVGLHATRSLDLTRATVLVIGSGPIGIATALSARPLAAEVTVTDADEGASTILSSLGISPQPTQAIAASARFDAVFDCVADDDSLALALRHARIEGTIVVVGLGAPRASISIDLLVQGDRGLRGSAQYSRASFRAAVGWLSSGRFDPTPLLSPPQPLSQAPRIFQRWKEDGRRSVRTIFSPAV